MFTQVGPRGVFSTKLCAAPSNLSPVIRCSHFKFCYDIKLSLHVKSLANSFANLWFGYILRPPLSGQAFHNETRACCNSLGDFAQLHSDRVLLLTAWRLVAAKAYSTSKAGRHRDLWNGQGESPARTEERPRGFIWRSLWSSLYPQGRNSPSIYQRLGLWIRWRIVYAFCGVFEQNIYCIYSQRRWHTGKQYCVRCWRSQRPKRNNSYQTQSK